MIEEKVRNLSKNLTKLSPSDKNFAIDNLDILHQNSLLSRSVSAEERASVSQRLHARCEPCRVVQFFDFPLQRKKRLLPSVGTRVEMEAESARFLRTMKPTMLT